MFDDFQMMTEYFSLACVYQKGMVVFHEHDVCDHVGLIVKGKMKMTHFTYEGEERVMATLSTGDLFGDFLIFSSSPYFPGSLIAEEHTEIMFMSQKNLTHLLNKNERFREFYFTQLSEKALNFNLHNKILMQHTIKEKLLMWMSYQEKVNNKIKIQSKTQLANYLNVTRPSLSRELSHMKAQGIIDYDRYYIYVKA